MVEGSPSERSLKYRDIVVAAQGLFGEVGYDKTSVREIADRAHIALGTLYSQFPDGKIGVLDAALTERVGRLISHLSGSEQDDPLEAFLDRVRRLSDEIVGDPFLRRVFLDQGSVNEPRLRERGIGFVNDFGDMAVAELDSLVQTGAAVCTDPAAVAMMIRSCTAGWIGAQASGTATVDHKRLLDTLADALRALLRPAPAQLARRRRRLGKG